MTEAGWLLCENPKAMLTVLGTRASTRKIRLFACACARQVWDLLADERGRRAVATAEAFADGLIGEPELAEAYRQAEEAQALARERAGPGGSDPTPETYHD